MTQPKAKTGKFSDAEYRFIDANCMTMTVEDIAEALNRSPETIQLKVDEAKSSQMVNAEVKGKRDFLLQLKSKPYWKDLQDSYTTQELERYQYHWMNFISQFKSDMTHSEEMQIMKLIDLEILIKRNLVERKDVDIKIGRLEDALNDELDRGDNKNDQLIISLSQQIMGLRGSQTARTKDYNDMVAKHMAMTRELKATRDQRLEKIETGKTTLFGWLKMHDDRRTLLKTSREAELMKLAMQKSYKSLGEYHTYADESLDKPILTPETVEDQEDGLEETN